MKPADDEVVRKPFRVQKRRLGRVKSVQEDKAFGFIEGEDFRDDVFFHLSIWQSEGDVAPQVDMIVEFEIDDDRFATEKRLRATIVRPTDRPYGKRMAARDTPHLMIQHHPKARKKRPTWRDKS